MDTYACSVPDYLEAGGELTDEAWEASGSLVMDCLNHNLESAEMRLENSLVVSRNPLGLPLPPPLLVSP